MSDLKITEEQGPMRKAFSRVWKFLSEDVWDVELSSLSALPRFGVNSIRVVQLVFRGFREDECPLHASALTFSTLMSIVPVLALSLAMASGLGGKEAARDWVEKQVQKYTVSFKSTATVSDVNGDADTLSPDQQQLPNADIEESTGNSPGSQESSLSSDLAPPAIHETPEELARQIDMIVSNGFDKIEKVSFGALGGVGLCVLLWMTLSVLGRVEASFNRVWGVTTGRTLWRKFTDYLSILFIMPLLIIAAPSLQVADVVSKFLNPDMAVWLEALLDSKFLKRATFFFMTSLSFALFLIHMPNTRVKWWPGFSGGLVTALLFIVWLWACAAFQVGVARAGKIYGSFAIVPILLLWVHVSWQIVFFGAEVAFAIQNCSTFRMEQGAHRASVRSRILLALALVTEAGRTMLNEGGPLDLGLFAKVRRIPVRFLNDIVDELVSADLFGAINETDGCYALLKAPSKLKVGEVFDSVLQSGVGSNDLGLTSTPPHIERVVEQATDALHSATADMTINDVINYRHT
jgi:membrane protein